MRILIDLQHPAHLHFFRHAAKRLRDEGHTVKFTGRDKDILVQLADELGIEVEVFGVCRKGLFHMGTELIQRQWRLQKIIRTYKPDVMMAIAGTYIASLGWLFRIPTYVFYDTEHATLSNLISYPFATCVYVPQAYCKKIRWRHECYNGYHELAYLHPDYFTPDPSVLDELGIQQGETFTIVRFVGWGAVHDRGKAGFSRKDKIRAVQALAQHGRVLVSAEGEFPIELEGFRLNLPVGRVHDLMAYASLVFGESPTMASEAAILGVPAVYINPLPLGYSLEQERDYGLVTNFNDQCPDIPRAVEKARNILSGQDGVDSQARRKDLLDEKIDVTEFLHTVALQRPYANASRHPAAQK